MKRAVLTLSMLAVAAGSAFAGVSKDDLKKLIAAGVSDDVITSFIRANGGVDTLSADDLVDLKKSGASDKLLQSILAPKAEPAPAPQPQPYAQPAPQPYAQPVQRETVYVDRPVYVERPSTTYYSNEYPTTTYYTYPSTATYCYRHGRHHHCTTHSTAPTYSYPSTTYYTAYPSYRHYSSCAPSFGLYHSHHGRRSSFTVGFGW